MTYGYKIPEDDDALHIKCVLKLQERETGICD